MPVTKSSERDMRVAKRRQNRNKAVRTRCKTTVTTAENLILGGELGAGKEAVTKAISCLDKAAESGVIHPNNAARRKSRLMKKLNKTGSAAETKKS